MKIAYSPFDDQATIDAILNNIKDFHRGMFSAFLEKFDLRIRVHGRSPTPLRDVRHDQQLYVFGHGSEGSDTIAAMAGSTLTMAALAEQLFMDGMSVGQQTLKLFSCNGGRGGEHSMASMLKINLRRWGMTNVAVYGYTECLIIGTTGKLKQKAASSGARAKSVRVRY